MKGCPKLRQVEKVQQFVSPNGWVTVKQSGRRAPGNRGRWYYNFILLSVWSGEPSVESEKVGETWWKSWLSSPLIIRLFLHLDAVYYESIKRELNKRLIFECRCDARLKAKAEGSLRVWWVSVWSGRHRWVINVQGDPQCWSLAENVADLALELWGEHHTFVGVQVTGGLL